MKPSLLLSWSSGKDSAWALYVLRGLGQSALPGAPARGDRVAARVPSWGAPTDTPALARAMLAAGLKAVHTCVDPRQLPAAFAGRDFDAALLADLPPGTDPCGEMDEFHTFCHAGPSFDTPIPARVGERVERDGFCFANVLPADDV